MFRSSIRRAIAGLALAALLAMAAPARSMSLRLTGGLPPQDLWSRAWSWLSNLWMEGGSAGAAATPRGHGNKVLGPTPLPKPPPETQRPAGDLGAGLDPDG